MSFIVKEKVLFEKARKAEKGDFQAQYEVACHVLDDEVGYGNDSGMIEKALYYLRNVAMNGKCRGLGACKLGDLYYRGKHIEKDYKQAVTWYRTALQSSCIPAYYNLGICFYYGNGLAQDYAKAFDSFMKG